VGKHRRLKPIGLVALKALSLLAAPKRKKKK
jgi:hypothetical protein